MSCPRFTAWRPYEHRVLARIGDLLLPVPINRTTVNRFFGLSLAPNEVTAFLARKAVPIATVRTAEDVVLSTVGRELYEAFFRGYTRKQWNCDPADLDKSVTARIPTRTDDDDRYFGDKFQAMPRHGFTRMFERMLDHPNITLLLGADFRDARHQLRWGHMVFTGPIGWDDERACENGLLGEHPVFPRRVAFAPLAAELAIQQRRFAQIGTRRPLQHRLDNL